MTDVIESCEAVETDRDYSGFTATYSPDDNKLRLYSLHRLDADTYAKAKSLGFKWAPRQQLFVAPMWTPAREDFLLSLAGQIDDEDRSLVERAEDRAERFEEYSERRAVEADQAHRVVRQIADHIPFGQPILVGHHSERRARKDAERIENGMRRVINLFETSEYWTRRAAAALSHAEYKERTDVRYRRIKKIEADRRKVEKHIEEARKFIRLWSAEGLDHDRAMKIANFDHVSRCYPLAEFPRTPPASQYEGSMGLYSALDGGVINYQQASEIAQKAHNSYINGVSRWLNHYDNRLAYERAMLGEVGGIAADRFNIEVGGQVKVRGEWATVMRVTKRDGAIVSVSTNARYCRTKSIEEVEDYRAPTAEQKAAAATAAKVPPLTNYPAPGAIEMTQAQWDKVSKDYKGATRMKASEEFGAHRVRSVLGVFAPDKSTIDPNERHSYHRVFITDAKRKEPPKPAACTAAPTVPAPERDAPRLAQKSQEPSRATELKQALAAGVQVVAVNQLFETPRELAARMVDLAAPAIASRVLEPSAGTGRLLEALPGVLPFPGQRQTCCDVVAVEINHGLAESLRAGGLAQTVIAADFLELATDELGQFDCILMNPPFGNAADIQHIKKALELLASGGRLVAICANGPRQRSALLPLVEAAGGTWEDLPAGSFKDSGTGVSAALLVVTKD